MNSRMQPKRALTVLTMVLATAGASCGSAGGASEIVLADTSEFESTTTTVRESVAPTTTAQILVDDEPVELPDFGSLTAGVSYLTTTDVPFSFSVAESETAWWAVVVEDWSVTMVFANMDARGDLDGPQLSLGVAESGATPESVVAAMIASAEPLNYQQSEGLFGGRDAIIVDGSYQDPVVPGPARILTGDSSAIMVVFETGRSYRSHVFEEDGRVFIISVEADPDDIGLVLAEAAPILESFQIGVAE